MSAPPRQNTHTLGTRTMIERNRLYDLVGIVEIEGVGLKTQKPMLSTMTAPEDVPLESLVQPGQLVCIINFNIAASPDHPLGFILQPHNDPPAEPPLR